MRHASATSAGAWLCLVFATGPVYGQSIRRVEPISPGSVGSAAVLVKDVPLVHTAQLLPVDVAGRIVGAGDIRVQLEQVLARLRDCLKTSGSDFSRVVQFNCYVAQPDQAEFLLESLSKLFSADQQPAVGIVITPLPHPEAMLAVDAVAVSQSEALNAVSRHADTAILPAGSRIYVSGAEPARSAAARDSGLGRSATVAAALRSPAQVFLQPMASAAKFRRNRPHFGDSRPRSLSNGSRRNRDRARRLERAADPNAVNRWSLLPARHESLAAL
jgi:enamine deaminase RidA (YjgF/YER057c/UK114 family)